MVTNYSYAILKACKYIEDNLNYDLTLERIAQEACLSKFHFQRIFTIYTKISPTAYAQLLRLKKASYQLAMQKEMKIIDIAFDAKFEGQESFSRAFKKVFHTTPKKFRDCPDWEAWNKKYNFTIPTKEEEMNVEIIELEEIQIAYLKHKGSHEKLNETVAKFIQWRREFGLSPIDQCQTFGIAYNDPYTTEPDNFEFDVCAEYVGTISENNFNIQHAIIPRGRCARVRHLGSHEKMNEKIYTLYRDWLTDNSEELRDFPLFFHYHNVMPLVNESELITDIYLPIK